MADALVQLKVGVRVCPLPLPGKKSLWSVTNTDVVVISPEDPEQVSTWTFPYVLPRECLQPQAYGQSASDLIEDVIAQHNGCILVYGQPKSGKTHTMFADEGIFDLTVRRLVYEIKNEEKGVRATLACIAVTDGIAKDMLRPDAEDYELPENVGLFGVPKTLWVNVKNIAECVGTVRKALGDVEALQSKPHVFVLFTISRAKNSLSPIGSLILGEMASLAFPDSVSLSINHTSLMSSSLVILGKILTELCCESRDDSILVSKSMNGEWVLSLVACITTNEDGYDNCIEVLTYANKAQGYPEVIRKLKKGEGHDASIEDKLITQLRSDIIDAKFDLQQLEMVHSKRLKDLSVKFGFDFDVAILKDADPMSRETKTVRNMRESVERMETCRMIKAKCDAKLVKLNTLMNEAKQVSSQNQIRWSQELQVLEEDVRTLKDQIDEIAPKPLPADRVQTLHRLQESFDASKTLIQKHSQSLTELHSVAMMRSEQAASDSEGRKEGRESEELQFRVNYKAVEMEAKQRFAEMMTEYHRQIEAREKQRDALEKKIRLAGLEKKDRIQAHIDECERLASLVKAWFDLIDSIRRGDFNEGVVPVVIPKGHMPEYPEEIMKKYLRNGGKPLKLPKVRESIKDMSQVRSPTRKVEAPRGSVLVLEAESNIGKLQAQLQQSLSVLEAMQSSNQSRRAHISSLVHEMEELRATRLCYKRLLRQQQHQNRVGTMQQSSLTIESNREIMRHVFITAQGQSAQQSSMESSLSGYDSLNVGSSLSAYTSRSSKSVLQPSALRKPMPAKEDIFEIAEY